MEEKKIGMTQMIVSLGINRKTHFPLEKLEIIRSIVTRKAAILGRKYTTHVDRKMREVTVKRLS